MTAQRLTPTQIDELTKAFAVCDKDGNGVITLDELGHVVAHLANVPIPDDKELVALMKLMDRNNDGTIELHEFIAAMADWIQDDDTSVANGRSARNSRGSGHASASSGNSGGGSGSSGDAGDSGGNGGVGVSVSGPAVDGAVGLQDASSALEGASVTVSAAAGTGATITRGIKRRASAEADRLDLHRKVSKFFLQFRVSPDFHQVRSSASIWKSSEMMDFVDDNVMQMAVDVELPERENIRRDAEMKKLAVINAQSANVDGLVQSILVSDSAEASLLSLCELLVSLLTAFPTPADRREISDLLTSIFEKTFMLIPRLVQLLQSIFPAMQWYAVKVLTMLLPGPRIASTPEDFWMHYSHAAFKEEFFKANGLPTLVKLVGSPYAQVREQAVLCVGSLARDHPFYRDRLLESDVLFAIQQLFTGLFNQPNYIVALRDVTWVISILCGDVAHDTDTHWHLVKSVLPVLAELLSYFNTAFTDVDVLANVCKSLAFLLPGVREYEQGFVCKNLVEFIGIGNSRSKKIVLFTIGQLLVDDNLTQSLLNHDLLLHIKDLLYYHEDSAVRYAACKVVCILAGARGRIQSILDINLVTDLVDMVINDKHTRKVAVRALRYLTRGTLSQILYLANHFQVIAVLCHVFSFFLSKDEVLENIYNYSGPCFDFDILHDAVLALNSVLDAGQIEADDQQKPNMMIQLFTMDNIAQIGRLLRTMREQPTEMLNSFKMHADQNGVTIEERIRHLLQKIKKSADMLLNQHTAFDGLPDIATTVDDLLKVFFSVSSSAKVVLIKCTLDADTRVIEIPRSITYEDFKALVDSRFGVDILITYKNLEGEFISVDRLSVLERLMEKRQQDQAAFINLHLFRDLSGRIRAGSGNSSGASVATPSQDSPLKSAGLPNVGETGFAFFSSHWDFNASTNNKNQLFNDLLQITHFGPSELTELLNKWASLTSATNGQLDRVGFEQGLREAGCTDPLVIEENFKAFDVNKDGFVSFAEFVCGLSTLTRGTEDEKLALMFRSYDLDGDGWISKQEMSQILQSCQEAKGETPDAAKIEADVQTLFTLIDIDGDQRITLDEFKAGVKNGALHFVVHSA